MAAKPPQTMTKMSDVPEQEMHGTLGVGKGWSPPNLVRFCDLVARPKQQEDILSHEYMDDDQTLQHKVKALATLIKEADHPTVYTGAGISTTAGLKDYASRADNSLATGEEVGFLKVPWHEANPTYSHYFLTSLYKAGLLKHWVQQNHDGLPQKAGYPQHALNEFHGAWYDPSNPVVTFWCPRTREDLIGWLLREEERGDLLVALGTSLSGMWADRIVLRAARKYFESHKVPLPERLLSATDEESISKSTRTRPQHSGVVLINLQQTQMDGCCSLRIFGKLDEVLSLLAKELSLEVPTDLFNPTLPITEHPFKYTIPYTQEGTPSAEGETMLWDLSVGAAVKLTAGPGKGFVGRVDTVPQNPLDVFSFKFPCTMTECLGCKEKTYVLGSWWVEEAMQGKPHLLPFVNTTEEEDKK